MIWNWSVMLLSENTCAMSVFSQCNVLIWDLSQLVYIQKYTDMTKNMELSLVIYMSIMLIHSWSTLLTDLQMCLALA